MSPRSLRIIATVGHGRHQLRTAAAPSASAGRVFLHEAQDSSCQLSPDLQNPILESLNWNCNLGVWAGGRSMHALGCGRTPFVFFVTRGFDKLYARFLCFRPSKLDNRHPGSSLSFFLATVLWATIQQQDAIFSELQVFRKGEPSRNTASWRTTASKEGRAWAVGWQDRGRKEGSGERRRKGKGMSSLLSSVQSPWHPFRHSYLAASAHPARQCQQMDHAWCVWRQASHAFYAFPKHFCWTVGSCHAGEWLRVDEDLVEQYPDDEAGPPADVPPSPCCFVDSPCFRFQPSTDRAQRAGEVANPHGLPCKIGQSAAAPRLRSCSLVKKACLQTFCNQSHKRSI